MKYALLLLSLFVLRPDAALSQILSEQADERFVTVYHQNFAGIYDVRTVELEEGRNEILLLNIPEVHAIDRVSVFFDGELIEVRNPVTRQGFASLMERLDGSRARLSKNGREVSGLLSWHENILSVTDGRSQTLLTDPRSYIISPEEGDLRLVGETALSVVLKANRSGSQQIGVLYGTQQLGWNAGHSVRLHRESSTLDWITEARLTSRADHDFKDVKLSLLSGDIDVRRLPGLAEAAHLRTEFIARTAYDSEEMDSFLDMDAGLDTEALADFFVYRMPGESTIESRTMRSFTIHENKGLPYRTEYIYVMQGRSTDLATPVAFAVFNDEDDNKIEATLPQGSASLVSMKLGEKPSFEANMHFGITSPGDRMELQIRDAVPVDIRESYRHQGTRNEDRFGYYTIRMEHTGTEPITLNLRNYIASGHQVHESSIPFERRGNYVQAATELQPGETKEVRLTIRIPQ